MSFVEHPRMKKALAKLEREKTMENYRNASSVARSLGGRIDFFERPSPKSIRDTSPLNKKASPMNSLEKYAAKRLLIRELEKVAVAGLVRLGQGLARASRLAKPSVARGLRFTGRAVQSGSRLGRRIGKRVAAGGVLAGGGAMVGAEMANPGSVGRGLQTIGRDLSSRSQRNVRRTGNPFGVTKQTMEVIVSLLRPNHISANRSLST